jgi:hypothetical protein
MDGSGQDIGALDCRDKPGNDTSTVTLSAVIAGLVPAIHRAAGSGHEVLLRYPIWSL